MILIVIPTYEHFEVARACVASILAHSDPATCHIALVDDASKTWPLDWHNWPAYNGFRHRFPSNGGLTRSWNHGLRLARQFGYRYTVCGNSDLLFTSGWEKPLIRALDDGIGLIGPVSNAPGHARCQNVKRFGVEVVNDTPEQLELAAKQLRSNRSPVAADYINGFCMMAKTSTWWLHAYSRDDVFDPNYKLTGNENELQKRWQAAGVKIAFHPGSFVFHYRSVSRPEALAAATSKGAFRRNR